MVLRIVVKLNGVSVFFVLVNDNHWWGVSMLENKLGITNFLDLAHEEERITKLKALELFDTNKIAKIDIS